MGLPDGCESEATARFRDHDRGTAEVRSSWTLPEGYLTIDIRGTEGRLHIETAPWKLTGVLETGRRISKRYLAERVSERRFRGLLRVRAVARPRDGSIRRVAGGEAAAVGGNRLGRLSGDRDDRRGLPVECVGA